jgi:hypothetical protein
MPDEPETYDLAFDPEDEPEAPPKPTPPAASHKPKPAAEDPETIPLELPDEPVIHDPRAAGTASAPQRPTNLDRAAEDPPDPEPEEPKAVSPAKARARREEQRVRAAQEQAEAEAKRKKTILTIVGAVIAVAIVAYLALQLAA